MLKPTQEYKNKASFGGMGFKTDPHGKWVASSAIENSLGYFWLVIIEDDSIWMFPKLGIPPCFIQSLDHSFSIESYGFGDPRLKKPRVCIGIFGDCVLSHFIWIPTNSHHPEQQNTNEFKGGKLATILQKNTCSYRFSSNPKRLPQNFDGSEPYFLIIYIYKLNLTF